MKLEELTKEKVLEEVVKLQYLYGLKHEIRYGQSRHDEDYTESVAEHVYGMHVLAQYFLPLEDPEGSWNKVRIAELITWHDISEVETGDIPAVRKTDTDRLKEREASAVVVDKSPSHLKSFITDVLNEYDNWETPEARFVKAIDKCEPLVHSYTELGKQTQHELQLTVTSSREVKVKYINQYPYIKHFCDVLHDVMEEEGYFYPEQK